MRIGFDTTPLSVPQTGVGTYTANLLTELQQHSDDVILPLTHYPHNYRWSPSYNGNRNSHRNGHRIPNKTLWMQAILPRQLAQLQLDVCHFTNNVAPIWSPCPTVLTIHDMTVWLFPKHHPARRLLAMRPVMPLAACRAGAIITVSQSAKADIVRLLGLPPEKVHVVYEAPAPQFQPLARGSHLDAIRHTYRLPERFILHVGTLEPRKNLVRLLEAWAALHTSGEIPHALVLVGKRGWKDDQIFATVERLGLQRQVHFLNYVPLDALVAIYNLAEVFVFPSLYEGFGLPIIEAMACGTPVVTSPNGSLREVAGEAAEFVTATATDSIASGLRRVLSDRAWRAELRTRGLAHAARFTWAATAAQTRQVYQKVLK